MKHFCCFFLLLFLLSGFGCKSSNKIKSKGTVFILSKDSFMNTMEFDKVELYLYNKNLKCYNNKNGNLIANDTFNTCFEYIKDISIDDFKEIFSVLNDTNSYGQTFYSCSNSEISFALKHQDTVCGVINISFECNQIYSQPFILGNYYRQKKIFESYTGIAMIGMTAESRKRILQIVLKSAPNSPTLKNIKSGLN